MRNHGWTFLKIVFPLLMVIGCAIPQNTHQTAKEDMASVSFFKVGHRGSRGLMPENTLPSFEKAIEIGANTIEFDVHITKDHKVVIYHDNSFTPSYTTKPDGSGITGGERKKYTFYQMNYADIRRFIIGEKDYPAFPKQKHIRSYAPLLSEMIDSIETFTRVNHYAPVLYLLEIKSNPHTDGFEQPVPEEFMKIMMDILEPYFKKIEGRLIIQSFDKRPLQVLHRTYPAIPLGYLTGDKSKTVEQSIREMGFTPAFYNPHYSLVNPKFLKECHKKRMKVLVWTVNKKDRMKKLMQMKVDGIITDYPDRLEEVFSEVHYAFGKQPAF